MKNTEQDVEKECIKNSLGDVLYLKKIFEYRLTWMYILLLPYSLETKSLTEFASRVEASKQSKPSVHMGTEVTGMHPFLVVYVVVGI